MNILHIYENIRRVYIFFIVCFYAESLRNEQNKLYQRGRSIQTQTSIKIEPKRRRESISHIE